MNFQLCTFRSHRKIGLCRKFAPAEDVMSYSSSCSALANGFQWLWALKLSEELQACPWRCGTRAGSGGLLVSCNKGVGICLMTCLGYAALQAWAEYCCIEKQNIISLKGSASNHFRKSSTGNSRVRRCGFCQFA